MSHAFDRFNSFGRLGFLIGLLVWGLASTSGCQSEPPDASELETTVEYRALEPGEAETLKERFLEDIREADNRIWAAVKPDMIDETIADTLVSAYRGEFGQGALEQLSNRTLKSLLNDPIIGDWNGQANADNRPTVVILPIQNNTDWDLTGPL